MSNYRVLFVPAVEKSATESFAVPAESIQEARTILNAIADYTLHMHNKRLMQDYSNFGCVEQFIDGEWEEVEETDA